MNLRHIEDNPNQRRLLSQAIGTHLKQIFLEAGNVVPEELVEYIVVLLAHGKPKNEVAHTLVDFLHEGALPFAEWLFKYVQDHWAELAPVSLSKGVEKAKSKRSLEGEEDVEKEADGGRFGKMEEGNRLKSAISIPEEGLGREEKKPSQGPAKRSRRHSPLAGGEDEQVGGSDRGGKGRSRRRRGGHEGWYKDRDNRVYGGDWDEKQHNKGHEANRRIFANALGAVSAQLGASRGSARDWVDEGGGIKVREEQKSGPGSRGRSVFDRLGKSRMVVEDSGKSTVGIRKGKQSVFERLENGSNVMNMEVRMDLQTHETKDSKEPAGTSSTITFTVNHSTQGQTCREPQNQDLLAAKVDMPSHVGSKASAVHEPEDAKQWEVQSLREKVARMQSEVEELRAKSKDTTSRAEAAAFGAKQEIDRRSVCVQNVHFMANQEVVAAHFSACGGCQDVVFPTGPFGAPKGYCFVQFPSPESVEKALELSGTLLMGRMIKVIRKATPLPGIAQRSPPTGFGFPSGTFPGRGLRGFMRPPFGHLPWGAKGGRYGHGRTSHKIVRNPSESVQETTSTVAQPTLDSKTIVDHEDEAAPVAEVDLGDIPIKDDDLDFEIDTGTQDDDIRAVLDGDGN